MTPEEALSIYHAGPDVVVKVLCELHAEIISLQKRVKALEEQIAQNSRNSSKPPSSDGPQKPKPRNLRIKTGRKPGGQKGHKGHTLKMLQNPDHTIVHPVNQCSYCACSLGKQLPIDMEKRQEFDLPPLKLEVTEHQAQIKLCLNCGQLNKAKFPENVKAPTQYGPRLKATAVYLKNYQLLPYERTRELLCDLFSCELSEGTLANINNDCFDLLNDTSQKITKQLIKAPVINVDETGARVEGKRQWLHVVSTPELTYYDIHQKRGGEAIDDIGILPLFQGRAIHDFWKPYFKYDCSHGLCNAHHLRELFFLHEQQNQAWAKRMIDCLIDIKNAVDKTKETSNCLLKEQIHQFEKRYQQIIDEGYTENPILAKSAKKKKRGRRKKSKARNLIERLDEYRNEALAFMYDFNVPFDNNLAERDIRMMKVQQKISGTFRSLTGAKTFCRIRSYISTAKKNAVNIIDAIRDAFEGTPFVLDLESG